jgi:hypothetical protein
MPERCFGGSNKETRQFSKDSDLDNLKKARIRGKHFLRLNIESFKGCNLPLGVSIDLNDLADQVRGKGKFISRT